MKLFFMRQKYPLCPVQIYQFSKELEDITYDDILVFAENKIKENFLCNDYREFLELIIIFMEGTPLNSIKFRQPGAYHLRWMVKTIYCLKIVRFRKLVSYKDMNLKNYRCSYKEIL